MQIARKYKLDMCNGPLFSGVILYSIPLMMTGILQLLYNAVNIVVVGRFVGSEALAAVGSTSMLINLIINLFIGLSIGASLEMAKHCGAKQPKEANETVHTSIAMSVLSGIILAVFGVLMATPLLRAIGTPDDVMEYSALYMKIYFLGVPASMIFNFSSAILRAVGDTRRPLYYLFISGGVNVALNLIFVIIFHMDVAGVAIATVISQYIAAVLTLKCLNRPDEYTELRWRKIRLHKDRLLAIVKIGLPAGIQSVVFAISDVLIQSSINSFGSAAMAGNAAAASIGSFIYIAMNSFYQASLNFTGQNIGAKKYNRIGHILRVCLVSATAVGVLLGGLSFLFAQKLLGIYTVDLNVIDIGIERIFYICIPVFLCGIMEAFAGSIRGMGYSTLPMLTSVIGICGIRAIWIYTVFAADHTLKTLYISYPASWLITSCANMLCFIVMWRKFVRNAEKEPESIY